MPRVLIKESSFDKLQPNQAYTIIIRNHGLIIKQITNMESLESLLIMKIEPNQVKKLELQEEDKEYVLYFEFLVEETHTNYLTFSSLELPISVLFDKLMKTIDPNYVEKSLLAETNNQNKTLEEQSQNSFSLALDQFLKKSQQIVTLPLIKGIEFIQLGMQELEKTLRTGIRSLTAPFGKKDSIENYQELINETIPTSEFLIQINKVFLNHIDSALEKKYTNEEISNTSLLLAEQAEINAKEIERPVLLFIHFFGLDLTFWKPYMNYFYAKGYRVIAYDMRGWGGSEQHKNDDYKFSNYYDDLIAFLKEKQLLDKEIKITIITGSLTGLMLLNKASNELNQKDISLVLLSSSDKIGKDIQELIKKLPPTRTWGPLKKVGKNKLKQAIVTKELDEPVIQERIFATLMSADNKVVLETLKNLKADYTDGLGIKKIEKLPFEKILLIIGEKDLIIPLSSIEHLKNSNSFKIQIIENGNHFIAFEKPELIMKEITEWLE